MPAFKKNDTFGYYSHIPKVGGTSITKYMQDNGFKLWLQGNCGTEEEFQPLVRNRPWSKGWVPPDNSPCNRHHWHAALANTYIKLEDIEFKFAVLRDPVERMVSEYQYRKKKYINPIHAYEWFQNEQAAARGAENVLETATDFSVWLNNNYECYTLYNYVWDNHFRPQSEFVPKGAKTFKFREWSLLQEYIRQAFDVQSKFPHINGSGTLNVTPTKEDRALIEKWYKEDYELIESIEK
jgi:hypothetical protein